MILGLTGRAFSGKDTAFKLIQANIIKMGVERRAFADKLKDSAGALLGLSRAEIEHLKANEAFYVRWDVTTPIRGSAPPLSLTMRAFLQRYGAEAHRDIFGQDFWLKAALPEEENYHGKLVVVTDVRYPNEATWVRHLGGKVVMIVRPDSMSITEFGHSSERPLPHDLIDGVIVNDGTEEGFRRELIHLISGIIDLPGDPLHAKFERPAEGS